MEERVESAVGENPTKVYSKSGVHWPTLKIALNIVAFLFKTLMFLTGISTLNDCPLNVFVPIYPALAGGIGMLTRIMSIANRSRKLKVLDGTVNVLRVLEFIWMVVGWYVIFSMFQPNYEPYFGSYCERAVYSTVMAFLIIQALYFILVITSLATKSSLDSW